MSHGLGIRRRWWRRAVPLALLALSVCAGAPADTADPPVRAILVGERPGPPPLHPAADRPVDREYRRRAAVGFDPGEPAAANQRRWRRQSPGTADHHRRRWPGRRWPPARPRWRLRAASGTGGAGYASATGDRLVARAAGDAGRYRVRGPPRRSGDHRRRAAGRLVRWRANHRRRRRDRHAGGAAHPQPRRARRP